MIRLPARRFLGSGAGADWPGREQPVDPMRPGPPENNGAGDLRDLTYLVVDHNPHDRLLIRRVLRAFGFRNVLEAGDAIIGFRHLCRQPVDLVVIEYAMPGLSGVDFTYRVRQGDAPNRELPIIMVSAHAGHGSIVEARDAGVHEFVPKPIVPDVLYRRIVTTVRTPRPFIHSATYVGPDRRRLDVGRKDGVERRGTPGLSPEAIADGRPRHAPTDTALPAASIRPYPSPAVRVQRKP